MFSEMERDLVSALVYLVHSAVWTRENRDESSRQIEVTLAMKEVG